MKHRDVHCSFCRKHFRDVGPLVEGPHDAYICGECIELCQSILEQEKKRRKHQSKPLLPNMATVVAELSKFIDGYRAAKESLASVVCAHYERIRGAAGQGCTNILLVGPSCSAKILIMRVIAHAFGVPFAYGRAESLRSEPNDWRSGNPFFDLFASADFDLAAAQRGILYIDAVDDPSAQEIVLAAIRGPSVRLVPPDRLHKGLELDTRDVIVVCGGTFSGLESIVAARGCHPEQPLIAQDFIACGTLPQFVGAFRDIIQLGALDEAALARIVPCVDMARLASYAGNANK